MIPRAARTALASAARRARVVSASAPAARRAGMRRMALPAAASASSMAARRGLSAASASSSSMLGRHRLGRRNKAAEAKPGDVEAQRKLYLELLRQGRYSALQSRYESGNYAADWLCAKLYVQALDASGQLRRLSFAEIYHRAVAVPLLGARPGRAAAADAEEEEEEAGEARGGRAAWDSRGTEHNPISFRLHTARGEAPGREFMWGLAKWIITLGGFATLFYVVFSQSGSGESKSLTQAVMFKEAGANGGATSAVRFGDVKGCDEAKEELQEIVEFLRDPASFTRLGGELPKGALLLGPPGTGKTLLAKAVAGEADVPFFYTSGSNFDEMFVGLGARRLRDLFAQAKKRAPCLIFIDEIDAVGAKRRGDPQETNAHRQTVNQLLVEMDGFDPSSGIIVLAATNFDKELDSALLRPGRFDKHISVPLPDVRGREQIVSHYVSRLPKVDDAVDPKVLARGTPGCSGADLANLVNSAAVQASRLGLDRVYMDQFEWARDKVLMGAERLSAVVPDEARRLTAFHEGGHTIVALKTRGAHPIHKATIIPRGPSGGMTMLLPEDDMLYTSREQLEAQLDVAMGGRAAEEIVYGADKVTTGASNDFKQATRIARALVMHYGMSESAGKRVFKQEDLEGLSPELRARMDREVRKTLDDAYARAKTMLERNRRGLDSLAAAMLERETLTRDEIEMAVACKPLPDRPEFEMARSDAAAPSSPSPPVVGARPSPALA